MITILCVGTRGDTQPYIALGLALEKRGEKVRIAASIGFGDLVARYGLEFHPIRVDVTNLEGNKAAQKAMKADNPLKMLLSFRKMKSYAELMQEDLFAACRGADMVIYHPGAAIGHFVARQMRIPCMLASPFPMAMTGEYPSVLLYGRIKTGKRLNLFSYRLLHAMLWTASKGPVLRFFKRKFGYAPDHFTCPFELDPAVASISPHVFPTPSDASIRYHETGYWFLEEGRPYRPSESLADFLSAGEPPVYIGFGSAVNEKLSERLTKAVLDALKDSGKRAILATGGGGLKTPETVPDNICVIDGAPHSWLFGRVCAVVHHGGAGTTAEGFRAGVPCAIIPFANDQFAWGKRAFDLGVGAKPIPARRLTSKALSAALSYIQKQSVVEAAAELGKRIDRESGVDRAARVAIEVLDYYL
jgi:sterol 3beta-glucosyltransferase